MAFFGFDDNRRPVAFECVRGTVQHGEFVALDVDLDDAYVVQVQIVDALPTSTVLTGLPYLRRQNRRGVGVLTAGARAERGTGSAAVSCAICGATGVADTWLTLTRATSPGKNCRPATGVARDTLRYTNS